MSAVVHLPSALILSFCGILRLSISVTYIHVEAENNSLDVELNSIGFSQTVLRPTHTFNKLTEACIV